MLRRVANINPYRLTVFRFFLKISLKRLHKVSFRSYAMSYCDVTYVGCYDLELETIWINWKEEYMAKC